MTVNYGASQTFSFTPDTGYHVDDVMVDGTLVDGAPGSYTFTNVTANHTIAVTFAINTYTLTPSVRDPRQASHRPAPVTVNYGASQTFSFTPDTGYHVDDVMVDGTSVGGGARNYTFTNVTANHTIDVTFAINTYTLTPSVRGPRQHRSRRPGDGELRRQPDLQLHPGHRLPRGRRHGGRHLGGAPRPPTPSPTSPPTTPLR